MIEASGAEIHDGVVLVRAAGTTLNEIAGSVGRVADLMGEIARATGEQSNALGEVNSSVAAMDNMTQQNAALVEQSSSAARSLETQVIELSSLIGFFNRSRGRDRQPARVASRR